jgi:hypothetical protein
MEAMMASDEREWRPGSFTKNFSWGTDRGLRELYEIIRIGFDNKLTDVPRNVFRRRVAGSSRPDFIPINFFLLNAPIEGHDYLLVDELVFQALKFEHSKHFDSLALFAFIYSMVGSWKGAEPYQQWPTLWAHYYIADRVARAFNWDTSRISADDIESFVLSDSRYRAKTARKLSTNLNFLLRTGGLEQFASKRVERWWVDAMCLALDRITETRRIAGSPIREDRYDSYLTATGFHAVSGPRSLEKDLAQRHIIDLFKVCGGRQRFNEESVIELTKTTLQDIGNWVANNPDPIAAVHMTNPRIVKTIPRPCAMLAKSLGFETFDVDELAELDIEDLVRSRLDKALTGLRDRGISPKLSAEELMKIMRDE